MKFLHFPALSQNLCSGLSPKEFLSFLDVYDLTRDAEDFNPYYFAINQKQFLFQLQMVILTLFCITSPRLISENTNEEVDFLHETALATDCNVFLLYYYWIFPIKGWK